METEPSYHFDSTTQFTWEGDAIALRQGSILIARGYLADWLKIFQHFDKIEGNDVQCEVSDTLAGKWQPEQQTIVIFDPNQKNHSLHLQQTDIQQLEDSLLELHQGCCGPVAFNCVADIVQEPDEVLGLLQNVTSFRLSAQQVAIAKDTIAELPSEYEVDMLDLYDLWEFRPELAYFAKALRFYFLSD